MVDFLVESLPVMGGGGGVGGDGLFVGTRVCGYLGAFFAGASYFVFCRHSALADAEAGLRCGVVDLCGARVLADFISGV